MQDKIVLPFKRKRPNKIRYSADKIYVSRAELKHTNTELTIMLYTYNKQKLSLQQYSKKLFIVGIIKELLTGKETEIITNYKNRLSRALKKKIFFGKEMEQSFFQKHMIM